jgi:hypothetical protein
MYFLHEVIFLVDDADRDVLCLSGMSYCSLSHISLIPPGLGGNVNHVCMPENCFSTKVPLIKVLNFFDRHH